MNRAFGPRRATWIPVSPSGRSNRPLVAALDVADVAYRSLCSILYNYAQSGHPGGSVSSGRIVLGLVLGGGMDYDVGEPNRRDADVLSYAAGHKALGLYALWALRDEIVAQAEPEALPQETRLRLRLEDLLGFRRNPTQHGSLSRAFGSKALDGHPTPATPFVRLATGASGVGLGTSLGLALAALDVYGPDAPRVHVLEGEGGLTPGRAYEAAAFAGTAGLRNAIVHLDWNQASIDSDAVARDADQPGDYVQWDPMEFFYLHDWNVVEVPDGHDTEQVLRAQEQALALRNGQPTAVVYRTRKGWRYGLEGRKSHGAGHKLCTEAFRTSLEPLLGKGSPGLATCEDAACAKPGHEEERERCFWSALLLVRHYVRRHAEACRTLARQVLESRRRLNGRRRAPRPDVPDLEAAFHEVGPSVVPPALALEPGTKIALREQLGDVLRYLNQVSRGAFLIGAADLLDSTAVSRAASAFPHGFFHAATNPGSRTIAAGGICEDGLSCVLTGVSSFGHHVGVGASYGAFLAPLGHIAVRLHAIGNQMRRAVEEGPYRPVVLICGHAGLKTGEDGPTHADPQALQVLQGNFVPGTAITLTPWEPAEIWPLLVAALQSRPAAVFPFVTRPREVVLDRQGLGLAPPAAAVEGLYRLRPARAEGAPAVVLQGSEVAYAFVQDALPRLLEDGVDLDVFYVSSAELFDRLPAGRREALFPDALARRAMGITGFTLPTIRRWILSGVGLAHTLYPFRHGRFLGSGPGEAVLREAGLDGEAQRATIHTFLEALD